MRLGFRENEWVSDSREGGGRTAPMACQQTEGKSFPFMQSRLLPMVSMVEPLQSEIFTLNCKRKAAALRVIRLPDERCCSKSWMWITADPELLVNFLSRSLVSLQSENENGKSDDREKGGRSEAQ